MSLERGQRGMALVVGLSERRPWLSEPAHPEAEFQVIVLASFPGQFYGTGLYSE